MYPEYTVISKAPRRRPVHKSSSGCERCKIRKIKCDERRPSCTQCKIKRIECPGYPSRPRLRWSRKHEIFEVERPNSENLARERRHIAERGASSDTDQCASNDGWWAAQAEGVMSLDSYLPSPPDNTDANENIPPTDEFVVGMGGTHDTSSDMDMGDFADVWSKELYRIIMESGDTGCPSYEECGTLSDLSSCYASSLGLPSFPSLEEEVSDQRTANATLEIPAEDLWDGDKTDSASPGGESSVCKSPTSVDAIGTPPSESISPAMSHEPAGSSVELVPFYFNVVCPILSTFDSEKNVFRTFVSKKWQGSPTMFYTIQSMAAAKLVWFLPHMRAQALEWRSLALKNLQKEISAAPCWDTELLFVVLLLGVSSSWFDIADLGIAHLEAVQRAILNGKVEFSDEGFDMVGFFRNALIYWEMVSCAVSHTVIHNDYANMELAQPDGPRPRPPIREEVREAPTRMVPHPWTGVASESQAIFARISRQIHALRTSGSASATAGLKLEPPGDFLQGVRGLDEAVWSYGLPGLHDISNVGDPNTPAIHHLLLAEAYMFANFYQLYCVFSDVRRRRVRWIKEAAALRQVDPLSWAGAQVYFWARILQQEDGTERWLRFLGRSVIIRLEQIQTTSGTSCVQALLLLVASTSLSLNTEAKGEERQAGATQQRDEDTADGQEEILRARQFVLDRLDFLCASNLSAPIQYVRNVVVEIFKRLDVGVDVFWMDVLQSMGLLTIIG